MLSLCICCDPRKSPSLFFLWNYPKNVLIKYLSIFNFNTKFLEFPKMMRKWYAKVLGSCMGAVAKWKKLNRLIFNINKIIKYWNINTSWEWAKWQKRKTFSFSMQKLFVAFIFIAFIVKKKTFITLIHICQSSISECQEIFYRVFSIQKFKAFLIDHKVQAKYDGWLTPLPPKSQLMSKL